MTQLQRVGGASGESQSPPIAGGASQVGIGIGIGIGIGTALAVAAVGLSACGGVSADIDDVDARPSQDATATAADAAPEIAGALSFDGINDLVLIPPAAVMNSQAFTVEFWVKFNNEHGGAMAARWTSAGTQLWRMTFNDGGILPRIVNAAGSQNSNHTFIPSNVWQHVAITANSTEMQTFINAQNPFSPTNYLQGPLAEDPAVNLEFGVDRTAQEISFLDGTVDEVRIWNRVLTQAELNQNRIREIDPATTGLIGYWRFNEAPGDQLILDSGPNELHGTLGATNVDATDDPTRVTSDAPVAAF